MRALTLAEAIEFATVGAELARAFREVEKLSPAEQRVGDPSPYDRWRALAIRYNEIRDVWNECPTCGQQPFL